MSFAGRNVAYAPYGFQTMPGLHTDHNSSTGGKRDDMLPILIPYFHFAFIVFYFIFFPSSTPYIRQTGIWICVVLRLFIITPWRHTYIRLHTGQRIVLSLSCCAFPTIRFINGPSASSEVASHCPNPWRGSARPERG